MLDVSNSVSDSEREYLSIKDLEYLSDTTDDVASIPDESLRPYLVRSPRYSEGNAEESSLKHKQGDMGSESKDETEEIIRGFLLEKDIISQEHQKEKEELVDSFMKDRDELIGKFRQQVSNIERKLNKEQDTRDRPKKSGSCSRAAKVADGTSRVPHGATRVSNGGARVHNETTPIYIRLDEGNVISAEEFLMKLKLEDKHDIERDTLERSFRDEKRLLKEKLELDYIRKLQHERLQHDAMVEDLRIAIKELKADKSLLERELRSRGEELKGRWNSAKGKLEANFIVEQRELKDTLERKHAKEMELQRENYERLLTEMKQNFTNATKSMNKKEKEISTALENVKDYEQRVRLEVNSSLQKEFDAQCEKLRLEKNRLSEQVVELTRQKTELAGKIEEITDNNQNKMSILNEFSNRLNREYEERLKKSVLENDRLHAQVESLRSENRTQDRALRDCQENTKRLKDELHSKQLLLDCHSEKRDSLRTENTDLCHEIDVLRGEKDELVNIVESYKNMESEMKVKVSKTGSDVENVLDKCKILERERLGLERKMALLGEELQQSLSEKEMLTQKLQKVEHEASTVKQLLEDERKEHDRLNDRFRRDADEIRKKESECRILRDKLRNKSDRIETEITTDAVRVEKIMEVEAQNVELQKRLNHYEEKQEGLQRKEREDIQKQYAKEFAKRIQALRRNYEEATDGLKKQIRLLRSKVNELEASIGTRKRLEEVESEKDKAQNVHGDFDYKYKDKERGRDDGRDLWTTTSPHYRTQSLDRDSRRRDGSDLSSNVRVFDYVHKHDKDNTRTGNYADAPARDVDLFPPQYKTQTTESTGLVRQGAFSRQRSKSLEASGSYFPRGAENDGYGITDARKEVYHQYRSNGDYFDRQSERAGHTSNGKSYEYGLERQELLCQKVPNANGYPQSLVKDREFVGQQTSHSHLNKQNHTMRESCNSTIVNTNARLNGAVSGPTIESHSDSNNVLGLPPIYKSAANGAARGAVEYSRNGHRGQYKSRSHDQVEYGMDSETERLERSVERLQERLESSHAELLGKLEQVQKSVGS